MPSTLLFHILAKKIVLLVEQLNKDPSIILNRQGDLRSTLKLLTHIRGPVKVKFLQVTWP